ncbi:14886_t:CDS:2 [Gigaspora margarita]|uniref:14886_t:CDS:1 n=1 Tax=Gigaspora margarita TaxID=4874 RepID=A0ABN7V5N6_GIGMA|nr:14886_t:CDS:2 [Gigaspora margarita]
MSTIKEQKNEQIQVKNNTINKILNKKEDDAEIKYYGEKINILNEKDTDKKCNREEIMKKKTSKKSIAKRKSKILKKKDAKNKCIEGDITEKQNSEDNKKKCSAISKWEVLKIKFDKKICEEILAAVKRQLMIFYLEIKRHIEILEKFDPLLVNRWLQYFIDFIDNDNIERGKYLAGVTINDLLHLSEVKCKEDQE